MSVLGVNLPGDGRILGVEAAALGARIVRFPLRFEVDLRGWMRDCLNAGVQVLLVGDSHPDSLTADEAQWPYRISQAEARYGDLVAYWQWGNEPDADRSSDSSFFMDQATLNRLNAIAKRLQPNRWHVLAGLCSGVPSWLNGVDLSLVDYVACHPYAKAPWSVDLEQMLNGYLVYGKPLCVTEYDSRTPGMSACLAQHPNLAFALVFAYHDDVPGFGLVDQWGNRRPSYFEFQQAAQSSVPDTGGVSMAEYVAGFKLKADELGADVVGEPLEDQDYVALQNGGKLAFQQTSKGFMVWSEKGGVCHFIPAR